MIDSRVIERVMRMGVEFRTGKYDLDGLFALAAKQIKTEDSNRTLTPICGYEYVLQGNRLQLVKVVTDRHHTY